MKTIEQQHPEIACLAAALNVTTHFRAFTGELTPCVWVDSTDVRASWHVELDTEGIADHPYVISFMPATADRLSVYTADTWGAVLLCILEDWQTIGQ